MSALNVQEGGGHYKVCKIQPIEYITANDLGYIEGNIVKYITRHKDKNGAEDIKKIIHYCELLLELQYSNDEDKELEEVAEKMAKDYFDSAQLGITYKYGNHYNNAGLIISDEDLSRMVGEYNND